jgi:hypothetical protein
MLMVNRVLQEVTSAWTPSHKPLSVDTSHQPHHEDPYLKVSGP